MWTQEEVNIVARATECCTVFDNFLKLSGYVWRICFISTVVKYTQRRCLIHMWFSEGIFPHERVELHLEFSVLFFTFFCMLRKNTMRWTCGIAVKILAVSIFYVCIMRLLTENVLRAHSSFCLCCTFICYKLVQNMDATSCCWLSRSVL